MFTVAALTMVKDDYFFLEKWVAHYGDQFGRDKLYVVSHGNDPKIREIAKDCSLIVIPGAFVSSFRFNTRRWRLLSELTSSLLTYHDAVICGDVDEFVTVDPALSLSLTDFVAAQGPKKVLSPLGLEVIHRYREESAPIDGPILGPRQYARYSSKYCKPCVVSRRNISFARGGHSSSMPDLAIPEGLFLFHMKFCDRDMFLQTSEKRRSNVEEAQGRGVSREWTKTQSEAQERLDYMSSFPLADEFDFTDHRAAMHDTWAPRKDGTFICKKHIARTLHRIPERFFGLV